MLQVCTNAAFCLCFPGWKGASCSERVKEGDVDSMETIVKSDTANLQGNVYPDPDMVERIWFYLKAEESSNQSKFLCNMERRVQFFCFFIST